MRKNDKAQQRSVSDNLSISPSPRNSMENNESATIYYSKSHNFASNLSS